MSRTRNSKENIQNEFSQNTEYETAAKCHRKNPVSEAYDFEMSEEVKSKIERADNKHCYISEESMSDLKVLKKPSLWRRFVKRTMDIVVSLGAISVLLVPSLLLMLVIFIDDPGKVFFRHYRVGKNGKRFKLYKFRTMKKETPKYLSTMEVEEPDKYVTRLGRVLRKYSIDEFPQLINVLKGDMSLVGPRPLISDEYEIHQMRTKLGIYNIRPGVTGLAQINGRDTVDPEAKVRWDYKYAESMSFKTDIKIIFATIPKVFGHVGFVEGYSIKPKNNSQNQPVNSETTEEEQENACV